VLAAVKVFSRLQRRLIGEIKADPTLLVVAVITNLGAGRTPIFLLRY
jgi:hypothetical protein